MGDRLALSKGSYLKVFSALAVVAAAVIALLGGVSKADDSDGSTASSSESVFSVLVPVSDQNLLSLSSQERLLLSMSGSKEDDASISAMGSVETPSGGVVTVVRQGANICITESPRGLANCGDALAVQAGDLYVASPGSCATSRIVGLVPDGVEALEVRQDGRYLRSIDVTSNIYHASLPSKGTTFVSSDGEVGFTVPFDSFASAGSECG